MLSAADAPTIHQTQLIYRTLSKLDRAEREAFVLYMIEGWSPSEIAGITHMPIHEVEDSIEQAKKFVLHQLKN